MGGVIGDFDEAEGGISGERAGEGRAGTQVGHATR